MSTYGDPSMLGQQGSDPNANFSSQYPPLPATLVHPQQDVEPYASLQTRYEHDPGNSTEHGVGQKAPKSTKKGQAREGQARLRKACDNCSKRKVKCNEGEPPCKACVSLEIPCTFERESKRRGPPNRVAESHKRQQMSSSNMPGHVRPSSPTNAAETLASLAHYPQYQPQGPSLEDICPWEVLDHLINDYFTYIHPMVPLPHEPTFRASLRSRDANDPSFVALLASMIGCLVACYPRRARQHFRTLHKEHAFSNPLNFLENCHKVIMDTKLSERMPRDLSINDAMATYLRGLTAAYASIEDLCIMYFNQTITILTTMGLHKDSTTASRPSAPAATMMPNGHSLQGPQSRGHDFVMQELSRRIFWAIFMDVRSLQHLGVSKWILVIPPPTQTEPWPALPMEVDDAYITRESFMRQPAGTISELKGFNNNAQLYLSCNKLDSLSPPFEFYKRPEQKSVLEASLQAIENIHGNVPPEILLSFQSSSPVTHDQRYPSATIGISAPNEPTYYENNGFDNRYIDSNQLDSRRRIQYEIQRAIIYVNHLSTKFYVADQYSSLLETNALKEGTNGIAASPPEGNEPLLGLEDATSIQPTMSNQDLINQRESIVKSCLTLLGSMKQGNMGFAGTNFISRVRQLVANLFSSRPITRKGPVAIRADNHFSVFLPALEELERAGLQRETPDGPPADEETAFLRAWAHFEDVQASCARAGAFTF